LAREKILYEQLLQDLAEYVPEFQAAAQAVAEIDVLTSFASRCAGALPWVFPQFVAEPCLHIEQGRHPVVEASLNQPFTPNDLRLTHTAPLTLLTGPNMGGKSTLMRQAALLVLLAHIGCPVPAKALRLGPFDRIFTRIGAADDLASGQSTFMVEMTETAHLLHHATPYSLVILDEMGRGTSTFDGLSLARATAEHLQQQVKALTLFATHYFELTALAGAQNLHMDAIEHQGKLVFLHQVKAGAASKSYGLNVAQMAGVPPKVVERARQVLAGLENTPVPVDTPASPAQASTQLGFFPDLSKVEAALAKLDVDDLSPKQALDWLYKLKKLL
jgi:DNA mismatch repair protein MutS